MAAKIEEARSSELKAIIRRAWVYSVLMLISTGGALRVMPCRFC
jgi:hypothetical protein